MSINLRIDTVVPADETWQRMKAVWDACEVAGIDIPDQVYEFFDECAPDSEGYIISHHDLLSKHPGVVVEFSNDYSQGYEIDMSKLPKNATKLRAVLR